VKEITSAFEKILKTNSSKPLTSQAGTNKTRKKAIIEYHDYQIPVTQLNGDMQEAKRD